jgi:beta-glucosidase
LPAYTSDLVACERHRVVALEAAEKSAVLLTNDGALPLRREKVKKLAVLGRLAALINTGDFGSSRVRPPYVVTPLEGLQRYLGEGAILTTDEADLAAARAAAKEADATIVVVGYTAKEEGEFVPGDISLGQDGGQPKDDGPQGAIGGDRDSLELPLAQVALIKAAADSGKPVIVVIVAGSAVIVETWLGQANAILQTFYSGMEGGTALAKLLFGEVSPSGKLPFTVAKAPGDYPPFDKNADRIEYGTYHGYTLFEREGTVPRFPFGHGLSYARFDYRALKLRRTSDAVEVTVSVSNTGSVTAGEVVHVYASFPGAVDRPKRLLKSFARVTLAPGETRTIRQEIRLDDLRWRDPATHTWKLESGCHAFSVAALTSTIDL